MMGRTHMAIGFLVGLLTFTFFGANPFLFVALVTFGALLPDVDHENSKINRLLPVTRWIPAFFKHRGFFHSVFPAVILFGVFWYFQLLTFGLPLAIGYLVHIASDCLTKLGCNLLYPITTIRIQGFIMTDGFMEFLTFGLVMIANVVMLALRVKGFF